MLIQREESFLNQDQLQWITRLTELIHNCLCINYFLYILYGSRCLNLFKIKLSKK